MADRVKAPGAADDRRRRELAAIHAMKKELALTDDCYRARVSQASSGRVNSAADLTGPERRALMDQLRALGAGRKVRPGGGKSRPIRPSVTDQQAKIRALWLSIGATGGLSDQSEAALAAWLHRQVGVDALQWLDTQTATRAIEQLKRWQARVLKQQRDAIP